MAPANPFPQGEGQEEGEKSCLCLSRGDAQGSRPVHRRSDQLPEERTRQVPEDRAHQEPRGSDRGDEEGALDFQSKGKTFSLAISKNVPTLG